jgi:hypothetical protein
LDKLELGGTGPRRKAYGGLGSGPVGDSRRNATEYVPAGLSEKTSERHFSSNLGWRTLTNEGLRREEVHASKSRTSSVGDEIYVTTHNIKNTYRIGIRMVANKR